MVGIEIWRATFLNHVSGPGYFIVGDFEIYMHEESIQVSGKGLITACFGGSGGTSMRRTRILHVLGQVEDVGGILSVLRNLQAVASRFNQQHVVLVNRVFQERRTPALDYRYGRNCLDEHASHLRLLIHSVLGYGELMRLLKREPFDVVHGHSRGALPMLALMAVRGRTVFFTNHTYATRRSMYRKLLGLKHMNACLLTPNMAKHYGIDPEGSGISFVPDCCSDALFSRPLVQRRSGPRSEGGLTRMVGVGSIVSWKKWDVLVDALVRHSRSGGAPVEFHHYGSPVDLPESRAYAQWLNRRIADAGLGSGVVFHGSTGDVETALRQADWFVLPSYNEPCAVALSEAMALGLPALVSASGGCVDLVDDGRTGVWFRPNDASDLAYKIGLIASGGLQLADPAEIREAAVFRSASNVASAYRAVYRRAGIG